MDMTPGRAAYEKFTSLLPYPNPWLTWEKMPEAGKAGWEEVAQAAIEERKHEDTCSICRTGKVSGYSDAVEGSTPEANAIGHHRAQAARELGIRIPDHEVLKDRILKHDLEDDMPFGREHYVPFKG